MKPRQRSVASRPSARRARPPATAGRGATRRTGSAPAVRRRGPRARVDDVGGTRQAIFGAAAAEFSAVGYEGASLGAISRAAGVDKAMVHYHFADKLSLYRAVVSDMLSALGDHVTAVAEGAGTPEAKVSAFVAGYLAAAADRPWFPPLMLREMAEGAPRLDLATLAKLRTVFGAFTRVLQTGQTSGRFRAVHPVLAYLTVMGPLWMNAARERVDAGQPGRARLPMFVPISHAELLAHAQDVALRMLRKDPTR